MGHYFMNIQKYVLLAIILLLSVPHITANRYCIYLSRCSTKYTVHPALYVQEVVPFYVVTYSSVSKK